MSKTSIIRALKLILNSDFLDLTIDSDTSNYGLRLYTSFNRIEAVNEMPQLVRCNNLVNLTANIITPVGYTSEFDNLNRETFIPVTDIVAVALVVKPDKLDEFLRQLNNVYSFIPLPHKSRFNSNRELLELFIFNQDTKNFDIGINAIDLSNKPVKGRVIADDNDLIWVRGIDDNVPPTFYIVLMDNISFINPIDS